MSKSITHLRSGANHRHEDNNGKHAKRVLHDGLISLTQRNYQKACHNAGKSHLFTFVVFKIALNCAAHTSQQPNI